MTAWRPGPREHVLEVARLQRPGSQGRLGPVLSRVPPWLRIGLPVLLLLWAGGSAVQAGEEAEGAPAADTPTAVRRQVGAWLKDLESELYEVREAARAGLKQQGLKARDLLEAVRDHEDPEVRRAVRALLARAPRAAPAVPENLKVGDFSRLGLWSAAAEGLPLGEALQQLGGHIGAHFTIPPESQKQTVDFEAQAVPCLAGLQELLVRSDLRMPGAFDASGGAALVAWQKGEPRPPRAFSGPMRITVLEVAATRTFGAPSPPKYAVKLHLEWAPFVQLVWHDTPVVEVARDPEGRAYRASSAMSRNSRRGVGSTSHASTLEVHLVPESARCEAKLAVLELSLPLRLRYDRAEVRLADPARMPICLDAAGNEAKVGTDETVLFHSLEAADQGHGQWVLDYTATLLDAVAQNSLQAYAGEADGHVTRLYVAGGRSRAADGTMRITARAYRGRRGKPEAVLVSWFRKEEDGTLRFRLEDIPLR